MQLHCAVQLILPSYERENVHKSSKIRSENVLFPWLDGTEKSIKHRENLLLLHKGYKFLFNLGRKSSTKFEETCKMFLSSCQCKHKQSSSSLMATANFRTKTISTNWKLTNLEFLRCCSWDIYKFPLIWVYLNYSKYSKVKFSEDFFNNKIWVVLWISRSAFVAMTLDDEEKTR